MKIGIIFSLLLLAGCEATPQAEPLKVEMANNYQVVTLFEKDGCTMYRFKDDGYYRYFAKCGKKQSVQEAHNETCGKGCTRQVTTVTDQSAE